MQKELLSAWINNCVGHRNHGYFIRFLFFAIIGCLHAVTVHVICAYHLVHQVPYSLNTACSHCVPPFYFRS